MNTILLQPTDVLFFRDGRPMEGSLAGHTAAWPLPDVTNHALHAALHRAGLEGVHSHRRGRSGNYTEERDRKFGCLATAGPFPVDSKNQWFFPRPKDAQLKGSTKVTLQPVGKLAGLSESPCPGSSLPKPLLYAVGNTEPPTKDAGGEPWISTEAFHAYLHGSDGPLEAAGSSQFLRDDCIACQEANIGIGIDPETQTAGQGQAAGKIYAAHYLRLKEGFRIGLLANAEDKDFNHPKYGNDLIRALLNGNPVQIVVGGQQRLCTATLQPSKGCLPLPRGLVSGFAAVSDKHLVKWVLITPAIWPEIAAGTAKSGQVINAHPGGWLPNWVDAQTGQVLLTQGPGLRKAERKKLAKGGGISARLVAAIVPKPIVVTGWALPDPADSERAEQGGAKSTHLAVPAGAVYYFEADSEPDARKLANALNWHGDTNGTDIKNRRSTLLGEKGYGLGVCGTWKYFGT